MIDRPSTAGVFLSLVLGASLLLVGCDVLVPTPKEVQTVSSLFEVTNDLGNRMTLLNEGSKTTSVDVYRNVQDISVSAVARVDPPAQTRASHLTYEDGTVYAGYKARGPAFKGGIDFINANDPTNLSGVNSLGSSTLDVQEVAYDADETALYVAGAMDPSGASNLKGTPALLAKVTNFSDPQSTIVGLTGKVGKSAVNAPSSDERHDVYVATDEEALYRFTAELDDRVRQNVENVEFRSVAATQDDLFTVDRDANLYSSTIGSVSSFTKTRTIASGVSNLAIGRLHARQHGVLEGKRLFLALGSKGFAVLDGSNSEVLFHKNSSYYTSVSLHYDSPDVETEPTDLVYAARPKGQIELFQIGRNGIDEGDLGTGLDKIGTVDLSAIDGVGVGAAQVNQVMGVGCNVYIANSTQGVVVLQIGDGNSCDLDDGDGTAPEPPAGAKGISFAAFCTVQDNFDADDVTITDVRYNDDGEPVSIGWSSDTRLSTVVLQAGPDMYNYAGGTSGGAASEAGTPAGSDQSPSSPCPSGENLVVKNENVGE